MKPAIALSSELQRGCLGEGQRVCTMLQAKYIESAIKHVLDGHDGLTMVSYAIGEDVPQFSTSNSPNLPQNSQK